MTDDGRRRRRSPGNRVETCLGAFSKGLALLEGEQGREGEEELELGERVAREWASGPEFGEGARWVMELVQRPSRGQPIFLPSEGLPPLF